jgi:hypothetical protein
MLYSSSLKNIKPDNKHVLQCIERFKETGRSGPHSPIGGVLCHIMNYCVEHHIDFQLRYLAGGGYDLERKDWMNQTVLGVPHDPWPICPECGSPDPDEVHVGDCSHGQPIY